MIFGSSYYPSKVHLGLSVHVCMPFLQLICQSIKTYWSHTSFDCVWVPSPQLVGQNCQVCGKLLDVSITAQDIGEIKILQTTWPELWICDHRTLIAVCRCEQLCEGGKSWSLPHPVFVQGMLQFFFLKSAAHSGYCVAATAKLHCLLRSCNHNNVITWIVSYTTISCELCRQQEYSCCNDLILATQGDGACSIWWCTIVWWQLPTTLPSSWMALPSHTFR